MAENFETIFKDGKMIKVGYCPTMIKIETVHCDDYNMYKNFCIPIISKVLIDSNLVCNRRSKEHMIFDIPFYVVGSGVDVEEIEWEDIFGRKKEEIEDWLTEYFKDRLLVKTGCDKRCVENMGHYTSVYVMGKGMVENFIENAYVSNKKENVKEFWERMYREGKIRTIED